MSIRSPDNKFSWLLFELLITLLPVTAFAGDIALRTSVIKTEVRDEETLFKVRVESKGSEAANLIDVSCDFGNDFKCSSFRIDQLKPDSSREELLSLRTPSNKTGSYEGVIILRYLDINGYPFSALSPLSFKKGQPDVSPINIKAEVVTIHKNSKAEFLADIFNTGTEALDAHAVIYLPVELAAEPKQADIQIAAKDKQRVKFLLKDQGAVEGSRYLVNLVVQTDLAGQSVSKKYISSIRILPALNYWSYILVIFAGCSFIIIFFPDFKILLSRKINNISQAQ